VHPIVLQCRLLITKQTAFMYWIFGSIEITGLTDNVLRCPRNYHDPPFRLLVSARGLGVDAVDVRDCEGIVMIGKRIYTDKFSIGDYGKIDGIWHACTPSGSLGNLGGHTITEHEDGTITVSPSILVTDGETKKQWHGYLERGVWREC
jgi:hypothetical protein